MDEDEIVVTSTRKKKKEKKVEKKKKIKSSIIDKKTMIPIMNIDTTTNTTNSTLSNFTTNEDLTPTTSEKSNSSSTSYSTSNSISDGRSLPSTPTVFIATTPTTTNEKTFTPPITETISSRKIIIKEDPIDLLDGDDSSSSSSSVPIIHSTVQSIHINNEIVQSDHEQHSIEQSVVEQQQQQQQQFEEDESSQNHQDKEEINQTNNTIIIEQNTTTVIEPMNHHVTYQIIEENKVEENIGEQPTTLEESNEFLTKQPQQQQQQGNEEKKVSTVVNNNEVPEPTTIINEGKSFLPTTTTNNVLLVVEPVQNTTILQVVSTPEYEKNNSNVLLSTPPPRFSSSLRDNTELCEHMRQILSTLMNHKYASHFNSPVNEKLTEFRDYSKFIKKPIDFSLIKSNFEKSHYVYIDEFIRDVQTVFTNSFMFHLESSPQVRMAKVLQDIFEKELDRVLPYWRAFELSPKVETNDSFSDNDSENSIVAAMESYFLSEDERHSRGATPETIGDGTTTTATTTTITSTNESSHVQQFTLSKNVLTIVEPKESSPTIEMVVVDQSDAEMVATVKNLVKQDVKDEPGKVEIIVTTELPISTPIISENNNNTPPPTLPPLNRVDLEVDSLLGSESEDSDTLSEFEEDATEIEDGEEEIDDNILQEKTHVIIDFNRNIETVQKLLTASEMYSFFKSYIHPLLKSEDLQISMKAKKDRYENILERMQFSKDNGRDIIIEDTLPHSTSLLDVSILAEKVRYREDRLKLKEIQISNKCEIQEQIYKKKEKELIDQKMKIETELELKRLELSNRQIEFENTIAQMQQEVETLKQSLEQTKGHLKSRDAENEILQQKIQHLEQQQIQLLLEKTNESLQSKHPSAAVSEKKEQQEEECDDFILVEKSIPTIENLKKPNVISNNSSMDILEQQQQINQIVQDNESPLTESDIMSTTNEVDYQLILEEDDRAKNAQKLDQTKQIQLQGEKCPCGREIWKDYGFMRKPRFCNYTNFYYCTKCHSNTCNEIIPAKILSNWDFKQYRVCDEASKYLKTIHSQPIICVSAVKPTLFDEIQNLGAARMIRKRLIIQWEYVSRCPMKDTLIKQHNLQHRLHYLTDTEMYSIKNLEELNMKQVDSLFLQKLSKLFHILSEHIINQCGLCQTKAKSLCACCATGPIYDFNISQVIKCQSCKLVFHKGCFTNKKGVVACPICSADDE